MWGGEAEKKQTLAKVQWVKIRGRVDTNQRQACEKPRLATAAQLPALLPRLSAGAPFRLLTLPFVLQPLSLPPDSLVSCLHQFSGRFGLDGTSCLRLASRLFLPCAENSMSFGTQRVCTTCLLRSRRLGEHAGLPQPSASLPAPASVLTPKRQGAARTLPTRLGLCNPHGERRRDANAS